MWNYCLNPKELSVKADCTYSEILKSQITKRGLAWEYKNQLWLKNPQWYNILIIPHRERLLSVANLIFIPPLHFWQFFFFPIMFSVFSGFVFWTLPECFLCQFLGHLLMCLWQMGLFSLQDFFPSKYANYNYSCTDPSSFALMLYQKSAQGCMINSHLIEKVVSLNSSRERLQYFPTKLMLTFWLGDFSPSLSQL